MKIVLQTYKNLTIKKIQDEKLKNLISLSKTHQCKNPVTCNINLLHPVSPNQRKVKLDTH